MSIHEHLKTFGFSEKESIVYLSLAESGKSTATSISRRTKISRSSVYFVLENLVRRNLVIGETKNKTTYFSANPPNAIQEELETQKNYISQQLIAAEALSKQLLPFFRSKQFHIPKLQFFEGKQAVREALEKNGDRWHRSLLERDETWWGFEDGSIFEHYRGWFESIWKRYQKEREERLNVKVFSNVPIASALASRFPKTILKKPPEGHVFPCSLWLMGDFIILLSCQEKPHYSYQLEDPALADSLRVVFRMLWPE